MTNLSPVRLWLQRISREKPNSIMPSTVLYVGVQPAVTAWAQVGGFTPIWHWLTVLTAKHLQSPFLICQWAKEEPNHQLLWEMLGMCLWQMTLLQTKVFLGVFEEKWQWFGSFCVCDAAFPSPFAGETKLQGRSHPTLLPILGQEMKFLKREMEPRPLLFHQILFLLVFLLK